MENTFTVKAINRRGNRLEFDYDITGEWRKYFELSKKLWIEYNRGMEQVPESVAVIPLISDVLPIVWLCDAELIIPSLDRDFYENLPDVKKGYMDMYPMLTFGGRLTVSEIVENGNPGAKETAALFSGGLDSYTTLLRHLDEKPSLLAVWGADIKPDDDTSWERVERHAKEAAESYGLEYLSIRTNFREIIAEPELNRLAPKSAGGWWYGLQHGIGLLGHTAPLAYVCGFRTVYIASSFPESMKGQYTCASDPTIDNHMRYCGCAAVHDGYEWDRQTKVRYVVSRKKETGADIQLRVCWESALSPSRSEDGGGNCCRCEKCYRTILEIVSEGGDPNEYGFVWHDADIKRCERDMKTRILCSKMMITQAYPPIQKALYTNRSSIQGVEKYQWIQRMDFSNFNDYPIKRLRRSLPVRAVKKLLHIVKKGLQ